MSLIVTPGAPPIFLEPSYINKDADDQAAIVASSQQNLVHRIYQMDPTAIWQGSLGASDSSTESIVIAFYVGVLAVPRTIDSLMLLNHNLKNFVIQYSTVGPAGPWTTFDGSDYSVGTADFALPDFINFLASPVSGVMAVQVLMYRTQPLADQNKYIGNFIATLSKFQLSNPPTRFKPIPKQRRVDVELADGSIDSLYFAWSDNSFTLFNLEFEFDYLDVTTTTDKSNLDSLIYSPSPFLIYPEPGDIVRNIYLGLFDPGTYIPDYNTSFKGGGRRIPFRIKQVGWL